MSEECTHNCETCGQNCSERTAPQDLRATLNAKSSVKKVIAVASGKGGVGKSLVTSLLACLANGRGLKTAVLDADITGPSIPKAFGVTDKIQGSEDGLIPAQSEGGIKIMSLNLLLENQTDPVVWRGPVIAGCVKQFWTDVVWGDVDVMFVDMPPGTGDVPLTVFQSLPVDGVIIVASPQELVGMIVEKAANMASMMNIPVLGLVENMSYFQCPKCGEKHAIFGESHADELAKRHGIPVVCKLPIDPDFACATDEGKVEELVCPALEALADRLTV
ncbi:MAG: Mrp/NBP35 family ATP-binding protein [Kiritimatiellae bacterium]|nr:Mrp/NBP35 family ATP-binding protein [Kiritimatiellia bacterium]